MERKPLKYYQDKLFVGGLSFKTTDQSLEKYFCRFGKIKQANVMKYTDRQVSRGFGFCIFENPEAAESAMKVKVHTVDGRKVDVRWALPKEMAPPPQNPSEVPVKPAIRKIFVGGLNVETNDNDLYSYFSSFGEIENASVMYHHDRRHSRGFGFVLFKSSNSVNSLMLTYPHIISGKAVDVKKACPKDELNTQPTDASFEFYNEAEETKEPKKNRSRDRKSPQPTASIISPQSPLSDSHSSRTSRQGRDSLQLEFFDEEDNNPLPNTYSYDLAALASPVTKSIYLQNNYGYDYQNNLLSGSRRSYHQDSQRFFTQDDTNPYGHLEVDWLRDPFDHSASHSISHSTSHSFIKPQRDLTLFSQHSHYGSLSGEQGSNTFGSSDGRPMLSPSYQNHFYSSAVDSPTKDGSIFESSGSGGHSLSSRPLFNSQNLVSTRYSDVLATDQGMSDDYIHSHYFSNENQPLSQLHSVLESPLYKSRDNEQESMRINLKSHDEFTWQSFDRNEEIDVSLSEPLNNRTFSKNRRSKNHLIFNSRSEVDEDRQDNNDN